MLTVKGTPRRCCLSHQHAGGVYLAEAEEKGGGKTATCFA
jgi:hypothetical protein